MADNVAVIILTFNSAAVVERTVGAAQEISNTVICVDSGSTDGTVEMLQRLGCQIHSRPFTHYADQRNWAIQTLGNQYAWQLHLDADEIPDAQMIGAIRAALIDPGSHRGFVFYRRTYFLGRALRFGGANNWHMRLFRSGFGVCENRLYDQHFLCNGPTRILPGCMHDMNVSSLSEWTARHNRWSDLEARELLRPSQDGERLEGRLSADPRERRRAYKKMYYRSPRYFRTVLLFLYRYVLQLGFLDGGVGFLYAFFQALWFRMLLDAKLDEALAAQRAAEQSEADHSSVASAH